MNSISANLNVMIKACEKVSKLLIRDFGEIEKLQVSKKGPKDFVTNSDIKTEKIIVEELKKARPNFSIISEENGIENNKDTNNTWIIDPIDEIISGLIYDPIKDEMFFAEKDKGSFLNNQRIRVSKRNNLEDCLIATSGRDSNDYDFSLRKSGSAALDLAYVACGRLDGYFQKNLNIWDIAAGVIIVKEAGGEINDIDIFNQKVNKIVASSNHITLKFKQKLVNF